MQTFPQELKEAAVARLCQPNGPSIRELAEELGVSTKNLYNWRSRYANAGKGNNLTKARRPQDWTASERLTAVIEAESLGEEELGAHLRKKGLHSHHLVEWREEALSEAAKRPPGRPKKDPKLAAAEEKIKQLERELRRKDRALAEQTALLILQKKARIIWGLDEEDE